MQFPIADVPRRRHIEGMGSYFCRARRRSAKLTIFAVLVLAGCKPGPTPYSTVPDDELHAKARTLALPERYDLYVEVWRSRIPRRPVLANDVAALGEPAWNYVLARAVDGKVSELLQALPILWAFDRRCSPRELNGLREHVTEIAGNDQGRPMLEAVDGACKAGQPSAD